MKADLRETHYRILNLSVSLASDSNELLDEFDRDYGWFRVPAAPDGEWLRFTVRLKGAGKPFFRARRGRSGPSDSGPSFMLLDQSLTQHPSPVFYALQQIVQTLFAEMTGFIVLHAGVLEKDGQALILSGPPRVGKSTLTMALLERGFGFLSDDSCPIDRDTGKVFPFPRSVWVVDPDLKKSTPGGRPGKRPVRPDDLPGPVCLSPCIPKWLICLDSGESNGSIQLVAGLRDTGEEAFIKDMAGIDGVSLMRLRPDLPEWLISYPAEKNLSLKVRRMIDPHRDHIWNIYRSDRVSPEFDRSPCLTPLSSHEAALRVIRNLKQEPDAVLSDRSSAEAPGAFFVCLTTLLTHCDCYLITVGRLEETIERIVETVGAAGTERKAARLKGAARWL